MRYKGLIMVLLVLFLLAGCSDSAVEQTVPEIDYVGVCWQNDGGDFEQKLVPELWRTGYQVMTADGKQDQTRQLNQAKNFIQQGCDVVIIEPVSVTGLEELVEAARSNQTYLIFIHSRPTDELLDSYERITYVDFNRAQPGTFQGQLVLELPERGDRNGDGTVGCMILRGPETQLADDLRTESCLRTLREGGVTVEVLCQAYSKFTQEDGQEICTQKLAQYGRDVEVIICTNDQLALGAAEAIKSRGWSLGGDFYLIGGDAIEQTLKLTAQGAMGGTVLTDTEGQVDRILELLQMIFGGITVEKEYYVNYIKVDPENAAQFVQISDPVTPER